MLLLPLFDYSTARVVSAVILPEAIPVANSPAEMVAPVSISLVLICKFLLLREIAARLGTKEQGRQHEPA